MNSAVTTPLLVEPFPLFGESALNESADYFSQISSRMSTLHSLASKQKPAILRRPRISLPDKVTHQLRLKYYQYEVTFGLYMLEPWERVVLNMIVLLLAILIGLALWHGLGRWLVGSVCRLVFYLTGSSRPVGVICDAVE
ncbi:uncharacterized protein AB675_12122 [Cyphellophora attinorum]|uniref:Uncharacterized protein n=1 Tax=Cyphellophora attinorum TaxID=1664694 RepID=A0A0N0NKZ3_9EURO|nr:uncharacterized protein AB675_12122 [Phialophora attinorum]KPI38429.1 hypothetical protein AB675_12122 [Phialophora attinorum]